MVPLEIGIAMVNYQIIRKFVLGRRTNSDQERFFVDVRGKPLTLQGYQNTYIYQEICQAIGITDFTFTENRRGVASKMRSLKLTGNTAMGHSAATQENTYDIYKTQQGALNKKITFENRANKGSVA